MNKKVTTSFRTELEKANDFLMKFDHVIYIENNIGGCARAILKNTVTSQEHLLAQTSPREIRCVLSGITGILHIFDSSFLMTSIKDEIKTVVTCCEEALNGDWDKTDEGFEAMQELLETVLHKLKQFKSR